MFLFCYFSFDMHLTFSSKGFACWVLTFETVDFLFSYDFLSENLSFLLMFACCIGTLCWVKFQFFALDLGLRLIILVPARKFNLGYY